MINFHDRNVAREWLRNHSRDVMTVMAVRAALRALPESLSPYYYSDQDRPLDESSSLSILTFFRCVTVPWVISTDPVAHEFEQQLRHAALAATAATNDSRIARASALYAMSNAAQIPVVSARANADNAAVSALTYGSDALLSGNAADAAFIENRRGGQTAVAELVATPLWLNSAMALVASRWTQLRSCLLQTPQDWEVWIDWYQDRLAGRPSDARIDLAKALLPNDLWKQRPQAVNAEIKRLIDESRTQGALPAENSLPKQAPSAANFQRHKSGAITIVPPCPQDRLADTDEVRDFYSEVVDKTTELLSLGVNMLGLRLHEKARIFQSRLPEDAAQAVDRLVWSSGNTLRSILAAHDLVAADRDPHPEKLDRGAAERLRDVVGTFNQLAVADPALRRRDLNRPGPQEHQRSVDELSIVTDITIEAAGNRFITTIEAGEELSQEIPRAGEVGTDLPARLGVELARDTSRNFYAGMMVAAYRAIRSIPLMACGEGGFASKEYFSGFYKAAGSATYVAVVGATTSAYFLRAEILQFLLSNSDVLRMYAGLAFQHSPGFMQMLEWLERNNAAEAGTVFAKKPK